MARAASSDWADSEGGRMRLVALPADAAGHGRAVLQIEPNPGWITYWREPGESGIPPQITAAPKSEATVGHIGYPAPKPISIGDIREIGYDAPVSFPIDFQLAGGQTEGTLAVDAFVGLCRQVCIPFQASLSVALPAAGQADVSARSIVAAADATLPESPSANFKLAKSELAADGKSVSLELALPSSEGEAPQIYLTGPSGYVFFRQSGAKRNGNQFNTDIAIGKLPRNYDIHGKHWGILVLDGKRAMETELAFD